MGPEVMQAGDSEAEFSEAVANERSLMQYRKRFCAVLLMMRGSSRDIESRQLPNLYLIVIF